MPAVNIHYILHEDKSMPSAQPHWFALDIGGANLKAAHSNGLAGTVSFELWKHPAQLSEVLARLAKSFPTYDKLAITMTAELCDCFATKEQGVRTILEATRILADSHQIFIWGTDCRFKSLSETLNDPERAAAANWLALAEVASRFAETGSGLIIDIGSTTTDLIPLLNQRPALRGFTDTERLRSGELVYAGIRRTPLSALATEVFWKGSTTGLAAEYFASTHDIYLILGDISPDPIDTSTADGRPATVAAARDRLARMVGADRNSFSEADALELSQALDHALCERLLRSAQKAMGSQDPPQSVLVSGSGTFLARRLAARLAENKGKIIDLDQAWGPKFSEAACAQSLLILAREQFA